MKILDLWHTLPCRCPQYFISYFMTLWWQTDRPGWLSVLGPKVGNYKLQPELSRFENWNEWDISASRARRPKSVHLAISEERDGVGPIWGIKIGLVPKSLKAHNVKLVLGDAHLFKWALNDTPYCRGVWGSPPENFGHRGLQVVHSDVILGSFTSLPPPPQLLQKKILIRFTLITRMVLWVKKSLNSD